MFQSTNDKHFLLRSTAVGLLGILAGGCAAADEAGEYGAADEAVGETSEALTVAQKQANMNAFYAMTNLPSVVVTMNPADWDLLKAEQPVGGTCNFDMLANSDRFREYAASNVVVTNSNGTSTVSYNGVEIKKKSFCGSFSTTKPSIKLKLPVAAEDGTLGTRYLVLNNSIQDASFVRQCLGYRLYGMAGLPRSRCNIARVTVSSSTTGATLHTGTYVNVEPIRERYIDNPDNGFTNRTITGTKAPGNLYEWEFDDFRTNRLPYIDVESVSKLGDKKDLEVAIAQIATGPVGTQKVVDMENFSKMMAMEVLLKHLDGFTTNLNNTYVYNDVVAVAAPNANSGQVRLKLIPWGIDQILSPGVPYRQSSTSLVGAQVLADFNLNENLANKIIWLGNNVFTRDKIIGELKTFIDQMETRLVNLGVPNVSNEIAIVRKELSRVRSAVYYFGGLDSQPAPYLISRETGTAMHASSSETLLNQGGTNFEVVHLPQVSTPAQQWDIFSGSEGYRVSSFAYGRFLHASASVSTPSGNLAIYTNPVATGSAPDYRLTFEVAGGDFNAFTGFFKMKSIRTGQFVQFATNDPTASGRQRVHQVASEAAATLLYFN